MERWAGLIIIFLLIAVLSYESVNGQNGDVTLHILQDKIILKDDTVHFDILLSNNTSDSIIFFSFKSVHEGIVPETYYMSDELNYPSGTVLFIKDKNGNYLEQYEPDIGYVDFDILKSKFQEGIRMYQENRILMVSNKQEKMNLKEGLVYFRPEPGEYDMFLIHYSGKNLDSFVSDYIRDSLEAYYSAKTFQGWIRSNTVELIVE